MNTKNSINESLEVIRRALEDEKNIADNDLSSNILILNQKVNSDGTIKLLQKDEDINNEINDIIDQKLSYLVENKIEKILDEKIPKLLKNYFDSK
jgi:flagellar motor component MotA